MQKSERERERERETGRDRERRESDRDRENSVIAGNSIIFKSSCVTPMTSKVLGAVILRYPENTAGVLVISRLKSWTRVLPRVLSKNPGVPKTSKSRDT